MRSKAPLAMMEQIVMVLVFAIAATVCLQSFALSVKFSEQYETTDKAILVVQNVAEKLKMQDIEVLMNEMNAVHKGNTCWELYYNSEWELTAKQAAGAAYCIEVNYRDADEYLWKAKLSVCEIGEEPLFDIEIAGQRNSEVAENA